MVKVLYDNRMGTGHAAGTWSAVPRHVRATPHDLQRHDEIISQRRETANYEATRQMGEQALEETVYLIDLTTEHLAEEALAETAELVEV
ncbi:MAG TPA: hypothetical protein VG992_00205 [Candidatus Saccharimonadales bacterium]|nr:hypothetical protein [Candidatus Saccharimonadales bacterium]